MKKLIAFMIIAIVAAGFFWPHCAEACAQHSWPCCGGLRWSKLLIHGDDLAAGPAGPSSRLGFRYPADAAKRMRAARMAQ
jgi:hypothetical protein